MSPPENCVTVYCVTATTIGHNVKTLSQNATMRTF